MARPPVFVHLGPPGPGEFLDALLVTHRAALAEQGVRAPAKSTDEMLRAALELRRTHAAWGFCRAEVEGTWAELCRRIFKRSQPAVIGHELLSAATDDQIALLLDGLSGREVHLVVTAQDAASTVDAGWRRHLYEGGTTSAARYRQRLLEHLGCAPGKGDPVAGEFWAAHDLSSVLARWTRGIRPHRVHVLVTDPDDIDPRQTLWRTLGELLGFDAAPLPIVGPGLHEHRLDEVQLEVLREVNEAVDGRISGRLRRTVVKRYFSEQVLADDALHEDHASARRLAAVQSTEPTTGHTANQLEALNRVAERWQKEVANAGYDVRGDLAHLAPVAAETAAAPAAPDSPVEAQVQRTTEALADVLMEVARLREHAEALELRNAKLKKKRKRLKRRLRDLEA